MDKYVLYITQWNITHHEKGNPDFCDDMDGPSGHYAKRAKSKMKTDWYHLYVKPKIAELIEWLLLGVGGCI